MYKLFRGVAASLTAAKTISNIYQERKLYHECDNMSEYFKLDGYKFEEHISNKDIHDDLKYCSDKLLMYGSIVRTHLPDVKVGVAYDECSLKNQYLSVGHNIIAIPMISILPDHWKNGEMFKESNGHNLYNNDNRNMACLFHEIGHIKNQHYDRYSRFIILKDTICGGTLFLTLLIASPKIIICVPILFFGLGELAHKAIRRKYEYEADEFATIHGYGKDLVEQFKIFKDIYPGTSYEIFDIYPKLDKRIARIENIIV